MVSTRTRSEVANGFFMTREKPRLSPWRRFAYPWIPVRDPRTLRRPAFFAGVPRKLISVQTEALRAVGPGDTVARAAWATGAREDAAIRMTAIESADVSFLFKVFGLSGRSPRRWDRFRTGQLLEIVFGLKVAAPAAGNAKKTAVGRTYRRPDRFTR